MPEITALDHLVLTVFDMEASIAFYTGVLGMSHEVFHPADGSTRNALGFGRQKINLHLAGKEYEPKAKRPGPGTADLCFLSATSLPDWQRCGRLAGSLRRAWYRSRGRPGAPDRRHRANPVALPARSRWESHRDLEPHLKPSAMAHDFAFIY